jgi:hypothetical protein
VRDRESLSILENILKDMDIPWNRKQDLNPTKLRWLQKNMGERNSKNVNFNQATELIERLILDG